MSSKNYANISMNNKYALGENEVKVRFMNLKSQNPTFFKEVSSLPHFEDEEGNAPIEERFANIDNLPTKKLNFFNEKDYFNKKKSFNSYLFQNK